MSIQEFPANMARSEPSELLEELLAPLGTIATRMDLLQRVTSVTPGLTDLERTVLLEGLTATQTAAQRLARLLETLIAQAAMVNTAANPGSGQTAAIELQG